MLQYDPPFFVKFTKDSLEKRIKSFESIKQKYPNRVPVLIERGTNESPQIDKNKFLVPKNITVAEFMSIIRERVKLSSSQAIFLLINNTIPKATDDMDLIYRKFKNEDGFLYITYSVENTFG